MGEKKRLDSWKEIASYLGCTERTAQRWEKEKGLPIQRLYDSSRSPVYACTDDLDQWQERPAAPENNDGEPLTPPSPRFTWRDFSNPRVLITGGLLIVIIATISLTSQSPNHIPVARFEVSGRTIAALDAEGHTLWQRTCREPIPSEMEYKRYDIFNNATMKPNIPYCFVDLNGNGHTELLRVSGFPDSAHRTPWHLECWNEQGERLWTYTPGEATNFGTRQYDDSWPLGFTTDDLDGDGSPEIIIAAHHVDFFPAKLVILNHLGQEKGVYYHSGWIRSVTFQDLDGDGYREILGVGTENATNRGCLFVLDSRHVHGCSPSDDTAHHRFRGQPPAVEKFYCLFPRDPLSLISDVFGHLDRIWLQGKQLHIASDYLRDSIIFYTLNKNITLTQVDYSSSYLPACNKLDPTTRLRYPTEGRVTASLDPILYWDGRTFTSHPTMTRYWRREDTSAGSTYYVSSQAH